MTQDLNGDLGSQFTKIKVWMVMMKGLHPHYQNLHENKLFFEYDFMNWIGQLDLPFYRDKFMNYDKYEL